MKLISLKLKNFATFEDEQIDFSRLGYPVFIEGKTGSGKTTFFVDAITTALFGKAYGLSRQGIWKEVIHPSKTHAEIELTFEVNGKKYKIIRRLNKNSGQQIRLEEFDTEKNKFVPKRFASEASNYIKEIVGLTYENLLLSAVVRQGEVYRFLEEQPAKRRNQLVELLKLKIFEKYKSMASKKKDELSLIRERLDGEIEEIKRELPKKSQLKKDLIIYKRQIDETRSDLDDISKKLDDRNNELQKVLQQIEVLSKQIGELSEKKKTIDELKKSLKKVERKLNELKKEIAKFGAEKLERVNEGFDRLSDLKEDEVKLEKLKGERDKLLRLFKNVTMLNRLKRELLNYKDTDEMLDQLKKEKTKIDERLGEVKGKITETKKHLDALKKGKGKCPVCGADLTEERKRRRQNELKQNLKTLTNEKKELINKTKMLDQKIKELEEQRRKRNDMLGQIKVIEKELSGETKESLKEKIIQVARNILEVSKKIKSDLEFLKSFTGANTIPEIKKKLREMGKASENLAKKEEYERLKVEYKEKIEKKKQEINRLLPIKMKYDELLAKKTELEKMINELRRKKEEILKRESEILQKIRSAEERIKELEDKEKELKEKETQYDNILKDIRALELLEKHVFSEGALPAKLLEQYLIVLNEYANKYLREFGENIEIDMSLINRQGTQSIDITMFADGYRRILESFSGGEATLIGFAIRLAIGRLIAELYSTGSRPKFFIIDEGFGRLDEDLRAKLANVLASLMDNKEYEQVFVISHERDLREASIFRTIVQVEKENNVSKIKIQQ